MNPVAEQIKQIHRDATELARRAETALKDLEEHNQYSRELAATPDPMNKSQFARLCGVSYQTVLRWAKSGRYIPFVCGGMDKDDAIRFIKENLPDRARQLGIKLEK